MRIKFAGYYRNNACFRTQGDGPERIRIKNIAIFILYSYHDRLRLMCGAQQHVSSDNLFLKMFFFKNE